MIFSVYENNLRLDFFDDVVRKISDIIGKLLLVTGPWKHAEIVVNYRIVRVNDELRSDFFFRQECAC